MKLKEIKSALAEHPDLNLRFNLPNGDMIPTYAHVTEVARIDKRYIDCGGTLRKDIFCRLQTLTGQDVEHRLTAGKLLRILNKAANILETEDIEVDVEHQLNVISQFPVERLSVQQPELVLELGSRQTACLAEDICGTKPKPILFRPIPNLTTSATKA